MVRKAEDAQIGDIFNISSQGESGTSSEYESILFFEGLDGTITVTDNLMLGDVNGDYTINILDIVTGINIILNTIEYTDEQAELLDFNGDGDGNILDLVLIVNYILAN